jgi:hypothetical protein
LTFLGDLSGKKRHPQRRSAQTVILKGLVGQINRKSRFGPTRSAGTVEKFCRCEEPLSKNSAEAGEPPEGDANKGNGGQERLSSPGML